MNPLKLFLWLLLAALMSCKKGSFEKDSHYSIQLSKIRNAYITSRSELFRRNQIKVVSYYDAASNFYGVVSSTNFITTKSAYFDLRSTYLLLGPYLYGNGQFTLPGEAVYSRIESYPINPEYVDYVSTNMSAGIINDAVNYPFITESTVKSWDNVSGTNNRSCGMHVLEFLLYGEDQSNGAPGNRSVTDYNFLRRRQYFLFASMALRNDFLELLNQAALKNEFMKAEPTAAFDCMMTGLLKYIKTDLADQCIKKPLDTQSEQYEMSRFSDFTMNELFVKVEAIRLFLDPRSLYISQTEFFLNDFIKEVDPDAYSQVMEKLDAIENDLLNIPMDFDQAILDPQYRQTLSGIYSDLIVIHDLLSGFKSKVLD
ncbi:imelysin family protein [Fluviicola sp.]|uniref:imelysin family protein n=1 Tax=Fluviicola sp. TaxID=1917219 RepID=UPI002631F84E|nr:imelysin family protein [Fluviicola sp.]